MPTSHYMHKLAKMSMCTAASLWQQEDDAKSAYIKARSEWADTRTAENIKGDPEKWRALCDRKMDCMRFGVII